MNFNKLANEAQLLADKNTTESTDKLILNLFLFPLTLGAFGVDLKDTSRLKEVAMSDDWVEAVADLPNISNRGLEFLAEAIKDKGWISIRDAIEFVEIENIVETEQRTIHQVEISKTLTGAVKLLARAEKELPGTIQRLLLGSKEIAGATVGAASFATEKTILIGKGLGAIAGVMKSIRKSM